MRRELRRELLEQTSQRFSERARSDGRSICAEAPDGLSALLDPLRMRQALGNLVDNALRHGSGTVVLSARAGRRLGPGDRRATRPRLSEELAPRASSASPAATRPGTAAGPASGWQS